jgi:hypothetical protein
MSGGKGGSKTTETKIPEWVRAPADRNLQRAEAVQQIEYMPYTGGQVAALTPTQEAAMNNNINTAKAFGLLDPNSNLTAMSGMPTPTTYDNGMKGYGSIGLYDQALAELTARNPENMAAYNALFGNRTQFGLTGGGGARSTSRFSGSANPVVTTPLTEQQKREQKMADVYANVVIDDKGNKGYTGQGNQSRAGINATPSPAVTRATYGSGNKPRTTGGANKPNVFGNNPRKNYLGNKRVTGGR